MHYKLISNDTHLEVPPDLWRDYIPLRYRDRGPRIVPWPQGGEAWAMDCVQQVLPLAMNLCAGKSPTEWKFYGFSYKEGHPGTGDADQRIREMEADGVSAEVEYPAVAGPSWYAQAAPVDRDLYLAVIQAYNDFISDFCMADPHKLWGLAMVPVTGIGDAVAELTRTRKKPGVRGWQLIQWPSGKAYPTPEDDQFWTEAVKLKAPLTAHVNFGGGQAGEAIDPAVKTRHKPPVTLASLCVGGRKATFYTIMQMVFRGVFDRFPDLKLHFAETDAGWMPYDMEQADDRFMRYKFVAAKVDPTYQEPKLLPSDYVRERCLFGFQTDHLAVKFRHDIGIRALAWGNDFPHSAGEWPCSQTVAHQLFKDVPKEEADLILWKNVADFYHVEA